MKINFRFQAAFVIVHRDMTIQMFKYQLIKISFQIFIQKRKRNLKTKTKENEIKSYQKIIFFRKHSPIIKK